VSEFRQPRRTCRNRGRHSTWSSIYPAQRPIQYALEVNQGYFARRGIGPGARITWERE
jgi:uncharacterized membrane protein (UPF0127 family)